MMPTKKNLVRLPSSDGFDDVVSNALDFFTQSINQIETKPKYSVINFCAGLELLLKARLLLEHWSLVMAKPEDADLIKFRSGDFQSVTMEASIKRLTGTCGEVFSVEEKKCYKGLRDHRNRLIHFYHDVYTKKSTPTLLEQIAAEQCNAWRFLHERLDGPWSEHFKRHTAAVRRLNQKLHRLRLFLKTKFASLSGVIKKDTEEGVEYQKCSSCGYRSSKVDEEHEPVFMSECKVCGNTERFLRLYCSKCRTQSSNITDITAASCSNEDCEKMFELQDVLAKYGPPSDPKDQGSPHFYCAACEYSEPSATTLGDNPFCFSCMQWFSCEDECRYCGENLVGFDPSDSAWLGCFMCEDAAAQHYLRD